MSLITVTNLSKSYGAEDLFSDVTFSIPPRGRMALVGPNGIGKTTLLRVMLRMEEPSSGMVQQAKGISIGYLPQEARFSSNNDLWSECLLAFKDLLARQTELAQLEQQMSAADATEDLLAVYGKKQQEFDHQGGYTYETRIEQTLTGLGFGKSDYHRPLVQLSGGQRTRALLARILLSRPDLLLLDEPTNHLDIEAVEWLEQTLKEWEGAFLVVSHDRFFLDQVADTILEMTPAIELYHGNYSAYLTQREERYQRLLAEYQDQQEFIEKEEEYIRRNIAGQNTRQAQGRRKRLERLLEESRLTPPMQQHRLKLKLAQTNRSGELVIRTYSLSVGYADEGKPLFTAPDLVLTRGECAAVIGPNGAGKTTFLKTLLGQIPPFGGECEMGSSLSIGYFAQAHESLHADWTLMDEISRLAPRMLPAEIRNYLAKFLFTGDDVYKEVKILSGGERGRLALAKLAMSGANLLLLDEPTNHLDLPSQEVLQSVMADFKGTILLVSHDRYLIDSLATQIWDVDPRKKRLTVFRGSYSEFKAAREEEARQKAQEKSAKLTVAVIKEKPAQRNTSNNIERRKVERVKQLEAAIAEKEARLKVISGLLEDPKADVARVQKLGQEYVETQGRLDELIKEWEEVAKEVV
jgi:ATP-binding cassette subfamily F protein 3